MLASENGVLAKLTGLRQNFLSGVDEARTQFVGRIKTLREDYISQVVDATLGDPKLSDIEKALSSWGPRVTVIPAPVPTPLVPVPIETTERLAPPEKQPMKWARHAVYGTCPNCNSAIFEPQAKFCSQCAYPLDEV